MIVLHTNCFKPVVQMKLQLVSSLVKNAIATQDSAKIRQAIAEAQALEKEAKDKASQEQAAQTEVQE